MSSFSKTEKILFGFFVLCAFISGLAILSHINRSYMVSIPARGGSFTEGIVGTPRFINPILAISDADKDLASLIYSGLLRVGKDGTIEPDLAESYEISPEGLSYTFILKENLLWSDGRALTSADIKFTIEKLQDPEVRSPKNAEWGGVTTEIPDERTVKFTLKKPYAPFLENAAIGILPEHIWAGLSAEQFGFSSYNTNPVGSGPYMVEKIVQNDSGIPEYYDLSPFKEFAGGMPFIKDLRIRFYTGEEKLLEAYKKGEIDAVSALSPKNALLLKQNGARVETVPLPRIFGVFLNQNEQELFIDSSVRNALNTSVDKARIIDSVLFGYGTQIEGPLPPGTIPSEAGEASSTPPEAITGEERIEAGRNILIKNGWIYNETEKVFERKNKKSVQTLSFSLSTSDAPELKAIAGLLKQTWEQLGARVELKVFESGDLNQNIIRPRKYDALLFGEIVGRNPDLYAFWHSSQRFDPGLNIALYANITSDKLLEKARGISNKEERVDLYRSFQKEISKDMPAIFLYSPNFVYVVPEKLRGMELSGVTLPSERFSAVNNWYTETQKVWKAFAQIKNE
ncbi:MAG: hypothetical protein HYT94_04605 [Parcubacteria group bacterium]|nr:hypothetical protein [Parcubacteria group bacterium]